MATPSRSFTSFRSLLIVVFFIEVIIFGSPVKSDFFRPFSLVSQRGAKEDCRGCDKNKESNYRLESSIEGLNSRRKDESVYITMSYMDSSGNFKIHKVKSSDLSSSWKWESSVERGHGQMETGEEEEGSYDQTINKLEKTNHPSTVQSQLANPISPEKLKRQKLRQKRKESRSAALIQMSRETELQMAAAAIKRTKEFKNIAKGRYSIWRKEYQPRLSDSTLKLMKDQIIMAKVYATIAASLKKIDIYDSLMKHIKASQDAIEEADSDADLHSSALEQAKLIGHALSHAKDMLYDCAEVARKLQAMVQFSDDSINAMKKQNTFLIQHAAKTVPKTLHCLPLQLATDYFLHNYQSREPPEEDKLIDKSLYHYAIFSDNVLATSVVVNSTVVHAKEPEKHVFHIVTDKLNFAAMKMWFIAYPPSPATVHVENIDEFKWLNSSYCSVIRQLESARIKEYYFKANHPSSLSAGNENLKYRNPKYLSMLNHLRFYMPEVYPKLDKILFLDDDIVVQKDLTPLWSIDMKGMVNGAVETCKESFHRFDTYLNFSNPKIAKNFDPQACGWAFGMNIFDLKEWKKRNITGIYHYWQDSNEDRKLWKLGSLPPGLITFYNLTYPLDRSWHVLGLGYDPAVNPADIKMAGVVHYNGNYKPWLDLAIAKYKEYWTKYVPVNNPYLQKCYTEQ